MKASIFTVFTIALAAIGVMAEDCEKGKNYCEEELFDLDPNYPYYVARALQKAGKTPDEHYVQDSIFTCNGPKDLSWVAVCENGCEEGACVEGAEEGQGEAP